MNFTLPNSLENSRTLHTRSTKSTTNARHTDALVRTCVLLLYPFELSADTGDCSIPMVVECKQVTTNAHKSGYWEFQQTDPPVNKVYKTLHSLTEAYWEHGYRIKEDCELSNINSDNGTYGIVTQYRQYHVTQANQNYTFTNIANSQVFTSVNGFDTGSNFVRWDLQTTEHFSSSEYSRFYYGQTVLDSLNSDTVDL